VAGGFRRGADRRCEHEAIGPHRDGGAPVTSGRREGVEGPRHGDGLPRLPPGQRIGRWLWRARQSPARSRVGMAFRRSAGDGERRERCGPPSWSLRWRRLAPAATSSSGTARQSLALMAAVVLCRGWRSAQGGARALQGRVWEARGGAIK
jgi:hypothetical protein